MIHRRDAENAEKKSERQIWKEISINSLKRSLRLRIDVHRALGPGLLESAYQQCLCHELTLRGIPFQKEVSLPVIYKGIKLDCGYRLDLLVDGRVVVETKSVEGLERIHDAQLLTYLRLGQWKVGLILNFNVPLLKDGIRRRVLNLDERSKD